ncbi:PilT/PilU family type 4a pilus ATPase, partial [bacterium]|nr:PilT/PilU family type 4a pilus ATPase [bacterium]
IVYFLDDRTRKEWEKNLELDTAFELPDCGRVRLNAYFDRLGPSAALRLIPKKIPSFADINLDVNLQNDLLPNSGLILVTGAAGTGKSTTLACLLDTLLQSRSAHVLTLEDPIEFVIEPGKGIISQREIGRHTHSFAEALNSGLRQDPDVILIGELRDAASIEMALTIAETGHLVFASLHSPDATGTIERVLGAIPGERQAQARTQLASTLRAILSQKLLARSDQGGRIAAREILINNPAIANLIRENKVHQIYSTIELNREYGMRTLESSLDELVSDGKIAPRTAEMNAIRPENLHFEVKKTNKKGRK